MRYRYVTEKADYSAFAAGHVIHSRGGMTSFPVRLASEIFQRCLHLLPEDVPVKLYDPCCGGGYLLTVLGFLHGSQINTLLGSDLDEGMIKLAGDNLQLLTHLGLEDRRAHLEDLIKRYDKASHRAALDSIAYLEAIRPRTAPNGIVWHADAAQQTLQNGCVSMMICDVPYGDVTAWQGRLAQSEPLKRLLAAQASVLISGGIAAIISDKAQKAAHPAFQQVGHETLGKRRIVFLQKR